MNISIKKLANKSLFSSLQRGFAASSISEVLAKQCQENKLKNAVRFENQAQTWTFQELDQHSDAFAQGLVELGYKPDDKVVFWFDRSHTSQVITAQIGAAKAGVSIIPVETKNANELGSILKESEAKGLFVSPNGKLDGERKYIDVVNETIPSLAKAYAGQPLKSDKLPNLKHVVHTGFYSVPGTLKYRQIMVYGNPNFLTHTVSKTTDNSVLFYVNQGGSYKSITHGQIQQKSEEFNKQNSLGKTDTLLIAGNGNAPSVFAYGLYNSIANGNYMIMSGNESLKDIVAKQRVQKSNVIIINDHRLTQNDVQGTLAEEGVQALKKVFISSSLGNLTGLGAIFGNKSVQKFDPLLA